MKANSILKTAFVSFAIMLIVINSCEKEPEYQLKDKGNNINNKVAANVVVFSSNELNNISSFNYSTGTMTFINAVNYSVGDIVVGELTTNAPDGLLRKVTGYSGEKTIYTEQATLEEAIVDGYLECQIQLTPNGKRGKGSGKIEKLAGVELIENAASGFDFNFQLTNIVLYDVDGNTLTTNDQITINGFINLSNTFDAKLSIKNRKLDYFLFQNVVNEESQIDIDANVLTSTNKEVIIWSQNFGGIVIGFIGPVPIVVTPQLDIKVGVDGSVSFSTINVLQNATLTGGIKYENSQWGNVNSFTNSFTFNNPTVSANINAKGYASASLSVLLYGVAGPYAEPSIYARLDASTSPSLSWNLYGGLEVIVGVKIQALSKTLAEYSATVISNEKILAQYGGSGSAPIVNFTANTATISVGGTVNFTDLSSNSPTSWSWAFGDGGTSTSQNPSHSYSSAGAYDVSLAATNSYGSDSETKYGYITVNTGNPNTVTIQPGPAVGKDAEIRLNVWPDCSESYSGFGNDTLIEILRDRWWGNCYPKDIGVEEEGLFEFNISQVPSNSNIVSATLTLYGSLTFGVNHLTVGKLASSWDESNVKWDTKPINTNVISYMNVNSGGGFIWLDITSFVQDWVNGIPNYGLSIAIPYGYNGEFGKFYSSDHSDANKRPKLEISYY